MSTDGPELREESNLPDKENQDELSLEQLSEAYAQVMREQEPPLDEDIEPEDDDELVDLEEDAEDLEPNTRCCKKTKIAGRT